MPKKRVSKFCLDVSNLGTDEKVQFAKMISDSVDKFNESIEDESQNDE